MHLKFIVFAFLVCSLLHEINARKGNKKKDKTTTTTSLVVTSTENGVQENKEASAETSTEETIVIPKTVSPKKKKKKNKNRKSKKPKATTTLFPTTTTPAMTTTTEDYDDDGFGGGFGFGILDSFLGGVEEEEEEEEFENNDNENDIPICDPDSATSIVTSYVLSGKLSFLDVQPLRNENLPNHQKRSRLNRILIDNGLPPLPKCRNASSTTTTTTQEVTTLPYCDEEETRVLIRKYIFERKISLKSVEPIINGEVPKDEMRSKMNKILKKAKLPVLPDCMPITTPLTTMKNKKKKTSTTTVQNTATTPVADYGTTSTGVPESDGSVIDILGLIFGENIYSDYDQYDDVTESPDNLSDNGNTDVPTCDPEAVKSLVMSYVLTGDLSLSVVQPLRSGKIPDNQKRGWLNRTLIENGLPPLPYCHDAIKHGISEATTTITGSTSTTEDPFGGGILGVILGGGDDDNNYDEDDQGNNENKEKVQPLRTGEIPEDQKRSSLNQTLVDNGLPPLPECHDAITQVTPEASTTTLNAGSTSTTEDSLGGGFFYMLFGGGDDEYDSYYDEEDNKENGIPVCDPVAAKSLVTSYVLTGQLSFFAVQPLRNGEIPEDQKRSWLNRTLVENGLPPLPNCRDVAVTTTTNKTTTTTSEYDNEDSYYDEEDPSTVSSCDAEAIKSLVTSYVIEGKLSMSEIGPVMSGTIPKPEVPTFLNSLFGEKGLPLLLPCDCSLKIDVTNITKVLKLVSEFERDGKLEEGTMDKGKNGEISLKVLERMLIEAEIEEGNLPESCSQKPVPEGAYRGSEEQKQQQQLNQLLAIIEAGYLPEDTLNKLAMGEISRDWLRANISQNRDYIMSQMPKPFRTAIEEGYMPPKIEAAIFNGNTNRSEIMRMVSMDDELIKMMMPENLKLILQDRPVPDDLKALFFSGKNETQIKTELQNDTSILQQMMTPSMFFFYQLFKNQAKVNMNTAISTLIIIVLMVVMVSLGCTMTIPQIAEHARKPKGVLIALFAQFVIMPASSFALTQLFQLEMYAAISVLICGCCPGGNLSNMLAYSLNGDMNLSILMTTCSSILGLGMMPFSIWLYSRWIVPDMESGNVVPYAKIMFNIAMTIVPVGIGIAIKHFKPQWTVYIMRFGAIMLVLCSVTIAVLAGVMLEDAFFLFFEGKVLACCAILPMTGYVFGYLFAWIARENSKCRRTICVETGCQNVQLCSVVLKLAFDPILVGVLFLLPLVYMCFQLIEAFLILFIFRMWTRFFKRKNTVDDDTSSAEKKKIDSLSSSEVEKGEPEKGEMKSLLDVKSSKENLETKETALNGTTTGNNVENDSDVEEIWPAIDATATPAYLDSFKPAKGDNFV